MARVLDAAGYRTVTADNGHDAVLVYEEHQTEIAMVLLDLVMPIMDGQTAAVRIRALSSRVPILFMTGYVPAGEMEGVRGSTVLRKPFKRDALLEATKGALRETGRAAD